jgi:hypothetical protein
VSLEAVVDALIAFAEKQASAFDNNVRRAASSELKQALTAVKQADTPAPAEPAAPAAPVTADPPAAA